MTYSLDGGETWALVAQDVHGEEVSWTLPNTDVKTAYVRVISKDAKGNTLGYDTIDEAFEISTAISPTPDNTKTPRPSSSERSSIRSRSRIAVSILRSASALLEGLRNFLGSSQKSAVRNS